MYGPNAARQLPGPDWLRTQRMEAAAALDGAGLPSPDEEVWRYSRIAELEPDLYAPTTLRPPSGAPEGAGTLIDTLPDRAALVVLHLLWHGAIAPPLNGSPLLAIGLTVGPLLLPLLALRRSVGRALLWVGILALFYFCHGVVAAWGEPRVRALASVEIDAVIRLRPHANHPPASTELEVNDTVRSICPMAPPSQIPRRSYSACCRM